MADIQLVKEVVGHIEKSASPFKRFNMDEFYRTFETYDVDTPGQSTCGTAMCFAGWAMDHKLGPELLQQQHNEDLLISWEAMEYLDLTGEEADKIFYSCEVRTIPQLKHLLNKVLGEEIFPEWEVDDQYDDGYGDE